MDYMALWLFAAVCVVLMPGYPVAFALAGTSLAFAGLGLMLGNFDSAFLEAFPNRLYATMVNPTLVSVPLFVFMGVMLEKSRLAEELLENMARLFGRTRGGLAYSVVLVGTLLAASTGIVGATIVTMGLMSLPAMLRRGYNPQLTAGTICATGTLGQIIPPSIVLVLLGDILSTSYQQAQLKMGIFFPKSIAVGDLFVGALLPGLALAGAYLLYLFVYARLRPEQMPPGREGDEHIPWAQVLGGLLPPVLLIGLVLGSILTGTATPTEAAGVGAFGAGLMALAKRQLSLARLAEVCRNTAEITAMVFLILIGAAIFSLVFRGFGGEELVHHLFDQIPGGMVGAPWW